MNNVEEKGNGGDGQADQDRHRQRGQVQAEAMQAGVQEVVSSGADGQVVHRGHAEQQDCFDIGGTVHRVRHLCQGICY